MEDAIDVACLEDVVRRKEQQRANLDGEEKQLVLNLGVYESVTKRARSSQLDAMQLVKRAAEQQAVAMQQELQGCQKRKAQCLDQLKQLQHLKAVIHTLQDTTACGVCFEGYKSGLGVAVCLPCGHTYCRKCIQQLRSCPLRCSPSKKCKADKLPINYSLMTFVEKAAAAMPSLPAPAVCDAVDGTSTPPISLTKKLEVLQKLCPTYSPGLCNEVLHCVGGKLLNSLQHLTSLSGEQDLLKDNNAQAAGSRAALVNVAAAAKRENNKRIAAAADRENNKRRKISTHAHSEVIVID